MQVTCLLTSIMLSQNPKGTHPQGSCEGCVSKKGLVGSYSPDHPQSGLRWNGVYSGISGL